MARGCKHAAFNATDAVLGPLDLPQEPSAVEQEGSYHSGLEIETCCIKGEVIDAPLRQAQLNPPLARRVELGGHQPTG